MQNKVVKSLLDGQMKWEIREDIVSEEELDERIALEEAAVPLSADSSQLAAIAAAAGGESFVLHGPPGTGKSQTIANMIANALGQGKTVLFVAEKMAALTVVWRRLEAIGLDPFCLELHSNKANKRSVLEKLERTLELGRIKHPEEYLRTAKQLGDLRRKLNEPVKALHKKRFLGISLYEAVCRYEERKNADRGSGFPFLPAFRGKKGRYTGLERGCYTVCSSSRRDWGYQENSLFKLPGTFLLTGVKGLFAAGFGGSRPAAVPAERCIT